MLCYHHLGNRSAALRQFFQCAELLKQELDVEPMPATLQLYQNIKDNPAASPMRSEGEPQPLEPASESPSDLLVKLHDLRQQVSELHSQIARMIKDFGPSLLLFSSIFASCSAPSSASPIPRRGSLQVRQAPPVSLSRSLPNAARSPGA
jgi:hypothetical protein